MTSRKVTPLLLTPKEVKKLLGRVPRGLTNCVVSDPKKRKLYRLGEVLKLCK